MTAESSPIEQAQALARVHGRGAPQLLIDEIVLALKAGDQARAAERGAVLRELVALADQHADDAS